MVTILAPARAGHRAIIACLVASALTSCDDKERQPRRPAPAAAPVDELPPEAHGVVDQINTAGAASKGFTGYRVADALVRNTVNGFYSACLGRAPDAGGFGHHYNFIVWGSQVYGWDATIAYEMGNFLNSPEFRGFDPAKRRSLGAGCVNYAAQAQSWL